MKYEISMRSDAEPLNLYDYPRYYEIAFSYRDIRKEVDVMEECIRCFSKIPVRRVLDLACGPAPHLEEFARRGYEYVGLDINKSMLDYAGRKARAIGIKAIFVKADMKNFALGKPVDFAFTMLGSLYVKTTEDILNHLNSVAKALKPGGLYLLDWCINFQWGEALEPQSWTIEEQGVKIEVLFTSEIVNRAAQLCRNKIAVNVNDHGKNLYLETIEVSRVIFPQEFLLLLEKSGKFEFIGWWNNWNLEEPIDGVERVSRPITLIRRL